MRAPDGIPPNTPDPWDNSDPSATKAGYQAWRKLLLCELVGGYCEDSYLSFRSILSQESPALQSKLSALVPPAPVGGPPPAAVVGPPPAPLFDSSDFDTKAKAAESEILKLPLSPQLSQAEKNAYLDRLQHLKDWKSKLIASAPFYVLAIQSVTKDLGNYLANIDQTRGAAAKDTQVLGDIYDPRSSKGACSKNWLGCQISFSVNAVNEVGTSAASVPGPTAKKAIASITVVYADPIFEVSAGAFFSTLVNRSFANQTLVTQNPGSPPTPGNVVIAQTIARPTVVPFVAANFRLGHDWAWGHRRREAFYLTGTVGLNPNNTTAEFGVGPSFSWRSLMLSFLYDWGHDVRLTQGEYVGEVWCNMTAANGSIPKCSGPPPSPSTEKYWRGVFAVGLSVRVPAVFGGGGSH